jgi:hypothetical protein
LNCTAIKRKQLDEGDVGVKAGQHPKQKAEFRGQYGIVVPLMGTAIEQGAPLEWRK